MESRLADGHGVFLVDMLGELRAGVKARPAGLALEMMMLVLLRMDTGVSGKFCLGTERSSTRFALQFLHVSWPPRFVICGFP